MNQLSLTFVRLPRVIVLLALSSAAMPAVALAQAAAPPPRHEGSAELAFVGTSGNSSTRTLSIGADHLFRPDGWTVRNRFLSVNSAADGVTTADSLFYNFRADHTVTSRVSAFGDYRYFANDPAGVAHRNTLAGGLAFKLIQQARQSLVADAGIGYMNEQRLTGTDISSGTYEAGGVYKLKLSDTAELTDEARILATFSDSADWRAANSFAVTAKLTSLLSLKFSNIVRYSHFPPLGFKTTDTTTAIALVAAFKRQ